MNPGILNEGTPFFVKESAIFVLVGIQEISAISFLSSITLYFSFTIQIFFTVTGIKMKPYGIHIV